MKKFKIIIVISIAVLLSSCATVKKGFSNQKKNSNDEFLVEKKSPLVLPPDYDELPIPNANENIADDENNKIEKLVKSNDNLEKDDNNTDAKKTFEESLLEKIKKN